MLDEMPIEILSFDVLFFSAKFPQNIASKYGEMQDKITLWADISIPSEDKTTSVNKLLSLHWFNFSKNALDAKLDLIIRLFSSLLNVSNIFS